MEIEIDGQKYKNFLRATKKALGEKKYGKIYLQGKKVYICSLKEQKLFKRAVFPKAIRVGKMLIL